MGDRAEVSHQLRMSDDHALRLGCWEDGGYSLRPTASIGRGPVRLLRRPRILRCGPLVSADGRPVVVGTRVCRPPEVRRAGWLVCGRPLTVGAYGAGGCTPRGRGHVVAAGDMSLRAGTFDAVGDGNPVPVRVGCPRLEGDAPGRAECPPPASEARSPQVAAEARDPRQSRRPPVRNCRESGWMTWIPIHIKDPCDKPDLFLVHLRSVQGSGILRGNRSTSYSGRRIPDRSGRPSVAFHQSNRQGRSRAPSSGQVRDDVPRGDQGAPGR